MRFRVSGIALAVVGAALATSIHAVVPAIPWLTAAVVLGIVAGQVPPGSRMLDAARAPGIRFSSKTFMRADCLARPQLEPR